MFRHDVRLAIRLLVKDRWYTAVAVLALGLGIGVNSTMFTFLNGALLRGLPYEHAERLMYLNLSNPGQGLALAGVSFPDYDEWRAGTRTFESLAAIRSGTMNVSDADRPAERILGTWVSAHAFRILGQQPLLGRDFRPGEDAPGAEPVAIVGYEVWQNRYGGDPAILGRTIRVNETAVKIVGVMPQGMKFPNIAEMWMPLVPGNDAHRRAARTLGVFGRLKPGVTRAQAQAEISAFAAAAAERQPETNAGYGAVVQPYGDRFTGGLIRTGFLSLMGAVALVLLIACANVASLLLARSASRAREMAVRVAMGATRWALVRLLLVQSVLLGCLAGVLGLALAYVGVRVFDRVISSVPKPYWVHFTMDGTIVAFLAVLCLFTGVLFGLTPAIQLSRANMQDLLKEGARGGGAAIRSRRFAGAMVVVTVALMMVLLVAAGLMVRSYAKVQALQFAFDTRNLVVATVQLAEPRWNDPAARLRFQEQFLDRVRAVPGVRQATVASAFPLGGAADQLRVEVEGRAMPDPSRAPVAYCVSLGDGFFETMGVRLRRGRTFRRADGRPGNEVAIVNERFASQFFEGQDPLGRRVRVRADGRDTGWLTIVGVAPDMRQNNPQAMEAEPVVYQPFRQDPSRTVGLLVRTAVSPAGVARGIRSAAHEVNPEQPLYRIRTYDEVLADVAWIWRVFGLLFTTFAVIAVLLSAIGLYAVTAYSVAQRTQEIGVRMALGADRGQVSWLIMRRGLAQLAAGTAIGLVGALFVSSLMQGLLVQMSPRDPLTFLAITALSLVITLAACLLPALRAMRVDPVVALRAD